MASALWSSDKMRPQKQVRKEDGPRFALQGAWVRNHGLSSSAAAVTCIHRQHVLGASGLATSHWKLASNRPIPAPAALQ
ncbi:hypothetical protein CCMA1212_001994 [Trichoderma ghanense]|uniref:Uncharacterized protein n=1 Tax=Trichoderma ghanense TaxID=65468 RepID=A0ABY2HDC4_9HYPO